MNRAAAVYVLLLAGCDPLLGDLDVRAPRVELRVSGGDARLIGGGRTVEAEIRGCQAGQLRLDVSGFELGRSSFEGCDVELGCVVENVVTATDLADAVGLEAFVEGDPRQPVLRAEGQCDDFGDPIGPVAQPLGLSPFTSAARAEDVPDALFLTEVADPGGPSATVLHARGEAGLRVLGYDVAPDARGALASNWYLWMDEPDRVVQLAGLGDLLLGLLECRGSTSDACGLAEDVRLVAADWGRKLTPVAEPRWGGSVHGLIASSTAAFALVDVGDGLRLAEIRLERAPHDAPRPRAGPIRDDDVAWLETASGRVAVGLDEDGDLHVAVVRGPDLVVHEVKAPGDPMTRIENACTDGGVRWVSVVAGGEARRILVVDLETGALREARPAPEPFSKFVPSPRGYFGVGAHEVTRFEGGVPTWRVDLGEDGWVVQVQVLGEGGALIDTEPDGERGRRQLRWVRGDEDRILLDLLHDGDAPERNVVAGMAVRGRHVFGATAGLVFRIDLPVDSP